MTHAHDTAADRCSRCDAHDGAPDPAVSRYPWKWNKYQTFAAIFGGVWRWRVSYRVPPDTARRRLRRRDMETLAWVVSEARRLGKAVR